MKAIIVDDEPFMLKRFVRFSAEISDLNVIGQFESAKKALEFAKDNNIEAAFLDVAMPIMNGIELSVELRKIRPDIIIVFVTASEEYIWDFNQIGGDYYIIKPYSRETIEMVMEKIRLIMNRQKKELFIQTFGRFLVLRDGKPLPITGKAKEILALVVTRRGKEISNEELYSTIWEDRPYSNDLMTVYYNALRRLRSVLKKEGIENLLISTSRGQIINTAMFDCDYYNWLDKNPHKGDEFKGEFLSEYSWSDYLLSEFSNE